MTLAPRLVSALLIAVPSLAACSSVHDAAAVSAGFVSHQLCSAVFVSGQDPQAYYDEAIAPSLSLAAPLIHHRLDRARGEVSADFAGMVDRRAVYRGATGCVLAKGPAPAPAPVVPAAPAGAPLLAPIADAAVVTASDPALRTALDRAFAEPAHGPRRWTKAVVIVHDGRIVAERYAPGYGPTTPIQGWSMTKSVINALLGILVRQGRLNVDAPAPIPAWSNPADPHHAITVDSLLRMTSGLDRGQSLASGAGEAFDPTARMVFDTSDMAGFAQDAPARWAPGTRWTYSNVNTLLLSRIIRDKGGGDAGHVLAFAGRELFEKLGMEGVTLEFDGAGTPIGASHMWAPARDWARFGQLYLDDGVVGGERILPEHWVDYSARPTPGSEAFGYGAGFWTNRGAGVMARRRVAAGMPADSFMARGSYGQYVVVIPSSRLVIVRMGFAYTPLGDIAAVERLTADAVAAVRTGRLSSRSSTQPASPALATVSERASIRPLRRRT
jgi:CubicO group peptidase (beta-lactamase class C family)